MQDLWAALCLVLIIEGLMPFINPAGFKRYIAFVSQMSDDQLRRMGLISVVIGVALLYVVRGI